MSEPRQVLPGTTLVLRRRCVEGRRLLRPDEWNDRIWRYSAGTAMEHTGVRLHAWCVLGNQHLLVLSDPLGELSNFARELHSNTARALNHLRQRCEAVWGPGSYSAIPLEKWGRGGVEGALDAMAEVICAPVAAGLVERPEQWPGVRTLPEDLGREWETARPRHFFSDPMLQGARWGHHESRLPDRVRTPITAPPELAHLPLAEARRLLRERVEALLAQIHARRRGLGYLGPAAIRNEDPLTPPGPPPAPPRPELGLRRGRWRGELGQRRRDRWKERERRVASREFLAAHREAWLAFRGGEREVLFPAGTWRAVRVYGARAERPPPVAAGAR